MPVTNYREPTATFCLPLVKQLLCPFSQCQPWTTLHAWCGACEGTCQSMECCISLLIITCSCVGCLCHHVHVVGECQGERPAFQLTAAGSTCAHSHGPERSSGRVIQGELLGGSGVDAVSTHLTCAGSRGWLPLSPVLPLSTGRGDAIDGLEAGWGHCSTEAARQGRGQEGR